jgi:cytochrome c oxidase cbb3-type subunit 3
LGRAALACAIVLVGLSCAGGPKSQRAGGPPGKPDGRALFLNNCATCHGEDGRAQKFHGRIVGARDLTKAKWQQSVTDEQIASAIELGPKAMPSFKGKFSPAEMTSLVAYVRQFKAATPAK